MIMVDIYMASHGVEVDREGYIQVMIMIDIYMASNGDDKEGKIGLELKNSQQF